MPSYATGNLRRVHYRKPSGETGSKAAWGDPGEKSTKKWISSKGWTYTHTTYTTTGGRQARDKPTQAQLKAQWEKQQGIEPEQPTTPSVTYPSGIVARYRGMDRPVDLGFGREPEFETRPKPVATFFDVERRAGKQAGITQAGTYAEKEVARHETHMHRKREFLIERETVRKRLSGEKGIGGHLYEFERFFWRGLSPDDLLWHKEIGEALFGEDEGKAERILDDYARWSVKVVRQSKIGWGGVLIEPFKPGGLGFLAVSTATLSIGLGSLSAAYPVAGKISQVGLAGYGVYKGGEAVLGSKEPLKELTRIGVTLPYISGIYRAGFRFGYGRTEAYLYKVHTYKPGTSEWVRFDQAMKVSRTLSKVSSIKKQPLDFAKDIMRMDETTADAFLTYYKAYGGVVGGGAASKTQIIGARVTRDLDYFLQRFLLSTDKKVALAKRILPTKTKTGKHLIDIHGKEMYYPGKYHRFGFISQRPVKIGGVKYFRGGEQLFRKGVASVVKEAEYRWFKDIDDFMVHARSQILSAKQHWWTRWKGTLAEKQLDLFLHPEKAPAFGKTQLSSIGKFIKATTKPVEPKIADMPWGYEYIYPRSAYPSYYAAVGISSYVPSPTLDYKPSSYQLRDAPTTIPSYKAPAKQVRVVTSYDVVKTIKAIPKRMPDIPSDDIPSIYKPFVYKPIYVPPPYIPPLDKTSYQIKDTHRRRRISDGDDSGKKQKRREQAYDVLVKDRYIVRGKKKYEERFVKVNKNLLNKFDALSYGATVTDNSAAQSFKIVPRRGTPKKPSIDISSWDFLQGKFRTGRGHFIERRDYAIDSPGEVHDISARGWVALKRKMQPRVRRQKQVFKPSSFRVMDKELRKMNKGVYF